MPFEVHLTGNAREEHHQQEVIYRYPYPVISYGDASGGDVERAIELSTTSNCSVSAMLRDSVKITHSCTIHPGTTTELKTESPIAFAGSHSQGDSNGSTDLLYAATAILIFLFVRRTVRMRSLKQ